MGTPGSSPPGLCMSDPSSDEYTDGEGTPEKDRRRRRPARPVPRRRPPPPLRRRRSRSRSPLPCWGRGVFGGGGGQNHPDEMIGAAAGGFGRGGTGREGDDR